MVARRLPPARIRLEAGPEGRLELASGTHSVGRAHARGGGAKGPGWSCGATRPTYSLKLSTAPAFISSVLWRKNAVTWVVPRPVGPSRPVSSPPNYPNSRMSPIIVTALASVRIGSGSPGEKGEGHESANHEATLVRVEPIES